MNKSQHKRWQESNVTAPRLYLVANVPPRPVDVVAVEIGSKSGETASGDPSRQSILRSGIDILLRAAAVAGRLLDFRKMGAHVARRRERRREVLCARELAMLSPYMLRDLGLRHCDLWTAGKTRRDD